MILTTLRPPYYALDSVTVPRKIIIILIELMLARSLPRGHVHCTDWTDWKGSDAENEPGWLEPKWLRMMLKMMLREMLKMMMRV